MTPNKIWLPHVKWSWFNYMMASIGLFEFHCLTKFLQNSPHCGPTFIIKFHTRHCCFLNLPYAIELIIWSKGFVNYIFNVTLRPHLCHSTNATIINGNHMYPKEHATIIRFGLKIFIHTHIKVNFHEGISTKIWNSFYINSHPKLLK